MDKKEIISFIKEQQSQIIDILEESIEVYRFLQLQFQNTEDVRENKLFQFVFRSFYEMDSAGLTSEFKNTYFALMQGSRNTNLQISDVAQKLKKIKTVKGRDSLQFSFISKLMHTINNDFPIWDSKICLLFGFTRPPATRPFDERLNMFNDQIETIRETYQYISTNNSLVECLNLFDEKFVNNNISTVKKLDFIFWTAGKIFEKEKNKNKM